MSHPPEIGKRFSALDVAVDPSAKRWQPPELKSKKKARPETVDSWKQWAVRTGVINLPEGHPDRRMELVRWGRWFMKQPNTKMAPNDPNREGPPPGWRGTV